MLRLIHTQTEQGGILVDDIDDGLPNKTAHRLVGDPNSHPRDGYANDPKQSCYIPRVKPTDVAIPGYIDLEETDRVIHSAGRGKIAGHQVAGNISVVSFVEGDIVAPVVTTAEVDLPAVGDVTIDGTGFLSTTPETTSVEFWGAGVGGSSDAPGVILTVAAIIAVPPGAVSDTQILVDTTIVPGLAAGDFARVIADAQEDEIVVVT